MKKNVMASNWLTPDRGLFWISSVNGDQCSNEMRLLAYAISQKKNILEDMWFFVSDGQREFCGIHTPEKSIRLVQGYTREETTLKAP